MRTRRLVAVPLAAAALLLAACGSGGDDSNSRADGGAESGRTIEVEMVDIAFKPTELTAAEGETVTFRFTNRGAIAHDAFVGRSDDQMDHEREMKAGGHDSHDGGDTGALTVDPGKTGTLTYTFTEPGAIEVGCHQPGHYAAGMKIAVTVT